MSFKKFTKIYAAIMLIIFATFVYMYFSIDTIKKDLDTNIDKLIINLTRGFVNNIDKNIKNSISKDSIVEQLHSDSKLRKYIENIISTISTDSLQYVYILYRDKNGVYRYLVDGSFKDRGELDQPLNVKQEEWDRAYKTKKDRVFYQKDIDMLWTTYLHPIVQDGKTEAILAIDFSFNLKNKIRETIKPLDIYFIFIFLAIFILALIFLLELYINYKIKQESYIDTLTKAYNRHYLRAFLDEENIDKYQILMIDIDYFKKINDNYGHKAGDVVLAGFADVTRQTIRDGDIFFRYGGEEFLVFVETNENMDIAEQIANRIKDRVEETKFIFEDRVIQITVSIGINKYPKNFKSIDQAIKYADEMLYLAKRDGRNCIRMEQKDKNSLNKLSIAEIKEAFDNNAIECYYQPIYSKTTQKILKYEALVRLIQKDNKVITPYLFLDKIFATTLYTELTQIVINSVFKEIKRLNVHISINLNFSDILDNKIYKLIIDSINRYKEYASFLTIELLEYEKIENISALRKRIYEIKSYGVSISLDDFGSGYANYEVFKQLPIDIIKIDGSLIKDLPNSIISYKIVKSIIIFARELNIATVAEFIHSEEVLESAKKLDFDYLQGFYLSVPKKEIPLS